MKYLLFVILLAACSHTGNVDPDKPSGFNDLQARFDLYVDSNHLAQKNFNCAMRCNKMDSADYYLSIESKTADSVREIYSRINPRDKGIPGETCNCQ